MSPRAAARASASSALLLPGLLLIAMNFRGPITGVAPILAQLQAAFALSPAQAGLLTTLPLLAFSVVSPFAAMFAREYGLERSLFAALVLVAGGVLLRSAGAAWSLFAGTAVIGTGIAIGNVLLPSLVKRDFPRRVPGITGACALAMGIAAALVSASAVPLSAAAGWQVALGLSVLLPLLAGALWIAQLGRHSAPAPALRRPRTAGRCGVRPSPGRSRSSSAPTRCCTTSSSRGCQACLPLPGSRRRWPVRCMG